MDIYPTDKEFVNYGVRPDIVVDRTINDYIQKKDPVADRVLEYLNKKGN